MADPLRFGAQAELCRTESCLGCGAPPPSDPDHVTTRGAGGLDSDTVPLCRVCHVERHALGIETFQARATSRRGVRVDLVASAARYARIVEKDADLTKPRETTMGGRLVTILEVDPRAFVFGVRFLSVSRPGATYDVARSSEGYWSCECWPFLNRDRCGHVDDARRAWERLRA